MLSGAPGWAPGDGVCRSLPNSYSLRLASRCPPPAAPYITWQCRNVKATAAALFQGPLFKEETPRLLPDRYEEGGAASGTAWAALGPGRAGKQGRGWAWCGPGVCPVEPGAFLQVGADSGPRPQLCHLLAVGPQQDTQLL